jgi:hypothetical protein
MAALPCPFLQTSPHTHPAERWGPTYIHACTGLLLGGDAGVSHRGYYGGVTKVVQECYEGATRLLQCCYKGVTMALHLCNEDAKITSRVCVGCRLFANFGSWTNVSEMGAV